MSAIWAKDIGFVILKCLFSAAVGAGINHHSELDGSVYSNGQIYVDTMVSANVELSTLQHPIVGEVGEVMLNVKKAPASDSLTIFQSMGKCYKLIITKCVKILKLRNGCRRCGCSSGCFR